MEPGSSSPLNAADTNPPSGSGVDLNSAESSLTSAKGDLLHQSFTGDFADATHDLLMDDAAPQRAAAAHRLAGLGTPLASPYLIAALSDNSWEVRQAAVEALSQIGKSEAIEPLQDLLDRGNQDALLQREIARAIQSISERVSSASSPADADNEKKGLVAIEANQNRAEAESRQQIEKEKQLAAEIASIRKAEADQLKRIQEANAESRRRAEAEARQRFEVEHSQALAATQALAEEEKQGIAKLEAVYAQAELDAKQRKETAQQLSAGIDV